MGTRGGQGKKGMARHDGGMEPETGLLLLSLQLEVSVRYEAGRGGESLENQEGPAEPLLLFSIHAEPWHPGQSLADPWHSASLRAAMESSPPHRETTSSAAHIVTKLPFDPHS